MRYFSIPVIVEAHSLPLVNLTLRKLHKEYLSDRKFEKGDMLVINEATGQRHIMKELGFTAHFMPIEDTLP